MPAEDTIAISSPIALVKGCANPDNGKLLYDFILSEEGQTVLMPLGARFVNAEGEPFMERYSPVLGSNTDPHYSTC